MSGKVREAKNSCREKIGEHCNLVVTEGGWHIEFDARAWDEGKDMMYRVTQDKIPQFLSDLKNNLQLYQELRQEGQKAMRHDVEGLREMQIRLKGEHPGVYLSDTFRILQDEQDLKAVEEMAARAEVRAAELMKELKKG
ncbi:MAG: hypothetical protein Q4F21_10870 [Lachnospiraceae bacterium]|nr:hypothetical protein [Lachnospiraceae bacterium]